MTSPSIVDIILGCLIVLFLAVFVIGNMMLAAGQVIRWFKDHGFTPHVEQTVQNMYGDVHVNKSDEPIYYAAHDIARKR